MEEKKYSRDRFLDVCGRQKRRKMVWMGCQQKEVACQQVVDSKEKVQ